MAPRGSGVDAPGGALRAIDASARPRHWAGLRPAPPSAALSASPAATQSDTAGQVDTRLPMNGRRRPTRPPRGKQWRSTCYCLSWSLTGSRPCLRPVQASPGPWRGLVPSAADTPRIAWPGPGCVACLGVGLRQRDPDGRRRSSNHWQSLRAAATGASRSGRGTRVGGAPRRVCLPAASTGRSEWYWTTRLASGFMASQAQRTNQVQLAQRRAVRGSARPGQQGLGAVGPARGGRHGIAQPVGHARTSGQGVAAAGGGGRDGGAAGRDGRVGRGGDRRWPSRLPRCWPSRPPPMTTGE